MFKRYDIKFERGSILTKEMLTELYEGPQGYWNILYGSSEDGVVHGLHMQEEEGDISIGPGLVKYEGCLYRMEEAYHLTPLLREAEAEQEYWLVIRRCTAKQFVPARPQSIQPYALDFFLEKKNGNLPITPDSGIAFAWMKLNGEQKLELPDPNNVTNLKAFTELLQWNMLICPYTTGHSVTYHPDIFQAVCSYIRQKKGRKSPLEYLLLSQIMSSGVLEYDFMLELLHDYGKTVDPSDRAAVLWAFAALLSELEQPAAQEEKKSRKKGAAHSVEGSLI